MISQAIWIAAHGLAFIWALTRWLPDARALAANTRYEQVAQGHLYGAYATLAMTGGYFATGILGIVAPSLIGEVVGPVLVIGSLVGLLPIYYFSRQLSSDPTISLRSGRWTWVQAAVAGLVMTAVVFWAFVHPGVNVSVEQKPPPFQYAATTMPMVDDVLCPGDPLQVEITGTTDGQGRTAFITGSIHVRNEPSRRVHVYTDISSSSISRPELAGQELTFVFDGAANGRYVPDLPPGEYSYVHGSYEPGSLSSAFEANFTVPEGCE